MTEQTITRTLAILQPWLEDGVPFVGLEPSCTAALNVPPEDLPTADHLVR